MSITARRFLLVAAGLLLALAWYAMMDWGRGEYLLTGFLGWLAGLAVVVVLVYFLVHFLLFLYYWAGDCPVMVLVVLILLQIDLRSLLPDYGIPSQFRPSIPRWEDWLSVSAFEHEGRTQLLSGIALALLFGWIAQIVTWQTIHDLVGRHPHRNMAAELGKQQALLRRTILPPTFLLEPLLRWLRRRPRGAAVPLPEGPRDAESPMTVESPPGVSPERPPSSPGTPQPRQRYDLEELLDAEGNHVRVPTAALCVLAGLPAVFDLSSWWQIAVFFVLCVAAIVTFWTRYTPVRRLISWRRLRAGRTSEGQPAMASATARPGRLLSGLVFQSPRAFLLFLSFFGGWWTIGLAIGYVLVLAVIRIERWGVLRVESLRGLILFGPHETDANLWLSAFGEGAVPLPEGTRTGPAVGGRENLLTVGRLIRRTLHPIRFLSIPLGAFALGWLGFQMVLAFPDFLLSAHFRRIPNSVVFCLLLFTIAGLYAWVRSYDSIRSRLAYLLGFFAIVFILFGSDFLGPDAYKLRYPDLGLGLGTKDEAWASYYERPAMLHTEQYLDGSFLRVIPIVGATNTSPIRVTSAVEHNLVTGHRVQVSDVRGNINANGIYTVTVEPGNRHEFSLDGSKGNGEYKGDGVWYPVPDQGLITDLRVSPKNNGVPSYEIDSYDHGLRDGDRIELQGFRDQIDLNAREVVVEVVDPNRLRFDGPKPSKQGAFTWGGYWRQVNTPTARGGILEASHTEPIVIRSPEHGLSGDETVEIEDVPLNGNANGVFRIWVVDKDRFSLRHSWGAAASKPGGTWRVVNGKGRVLDASNTAGAPIRIRSEGHNLSAGDRVEIRGVRGNVRANGIFAVANRSDDWFEIQARESSGDPRYDYVGGGNWTLLSRQGHASPRGEIEAASNTRGLPILIRSPSHSLQDGDRIVIRGVNRRANRVYTVQRVDPNAFVLNGSVASGDPPDDYNSGEISSNAPVDRESQRRMGGQWERVHDRGPVIGLSVEGKPGESQRLSIHSPSHDVQVGDHLGVVGIPDLHDEMLYAVTEVEPTGKGFVISGGFGGGEDLKRICDQYNRIVGTQGPIANWRRYRGRGSVSGFAQTEPGVYRIVSPRHGLKVRDHVAVRDTPWSAESNRSFEVIQVSEDQKTPDGQELFWIKGVPRTKDGTPPTAPTAATDKGGKPEEAPKKSADPPSVESPGASDPSTLTYRGASWYYVTGPPSPSISSSTEGSGPEEDRTQVDWPWTMGRPGERVGVGFCEASVGDGLSTTSGENAGQPHDATPGPSCRVLIKAGNQGLRRGERMLISGAVLWQSPEKSKGTAKAEPLSLSTLHAAVLQDSGTEILLSIFEPVKRWSSSMTDDLAGRIRKGEFTMDGVWAFAPELGWGTLEAPHGVWQIREEGPIPSPDARIIATGLEGSRSILRVTSSDLGEARFGLDVPQGVQPEPILKPTTSESAGSGPPATTPVVNNPVIRWQDLGLLSSSEVLTSWLISRQRQPLGTSREPETSTRLTRKPKLVLIAVSGGGIFAAVWTAVVLREIEGKIPEFPYHVRVVTGASGGMLGAAYYVASLLPPDELGRVRREIEPADRLVRDLEQDYLTPVANQMILGDLPGMLIWPFTNKRDRGRALEQAWIERTGGPATSPLNRPFRDLAGGELAGWRPSLVFTPMLVEDGRRLLISNLNLDVIPRNVGPNLNPPEELRISRSVRSQRLGVDEPFDIYSLSAVEFFRLFPHANAFKLSTAVRMSAAFPWVAPSVALPTDPPRTVVDAGYYDNFGVNMAAFWIFNHRDWLSENTSGVLLIQVRASQYERERRELNPAEGSESNADGLVGILRRTGWMRPQLLERLFYTPLGLVSTGASWLTTPLSGLYTARQAMMSFRNDEQLDQLSQLINEDFRNKLKRADFFQSVVFECPTPAAVSWTLSRQEQADIEYGFAPGLVDPAHNEEALRNLERLGQMVRWWDRE